MMFRSSSLPSALAAVFTLLLVSGDSHARPKVSSATGGGTIEVAGGLNTVSFTARVDDTGEVRGQAQFQLRDQDLRLHVEVDCLTVVGNEAWIGGVVSSSSDPARVGTRVTWRVQDNGEGGGAIDQGSMPVPGAVGDCALQPLLVLLPWTNGNVQVK